jgi:hypothetical protein
MIEVSARVMNRSPFRLGVRVSEVHLEIPDEKLTVSDSERRDFFVLARKSRACTEAYEEYRLAERRDPVPPPGRKRTFLGQKIRTEAGVDYQCCFTYAWVVELVDTRDLKSLGACRRAGSIPAPGTSLYAYSGFE